MTKKEKFIEEIEQIIIDRVKTFGPEKDLSEDAKTYFEALKGGTDKEKPLFTENGKLILSFIKENKDSYNNLFKAKDIGEGIGISSKTASGAMRKLVTDGYLEKIGENPVVYALTGKGVEINIENA